MKWSATGCEVAGLKPAWALLAFIKSHLSNVISALHTPRSPACDPVSFVLGNQKVARFIFSLYRRSAGAINSQRRFKHRRETRGNWRRSSSTLMPLITGSSETGGLELFYWRYCTETQALWVQQEEKNSMCENQFIDVHDRSFGTFLPKDLNVFNDIAVVIDHHGVDIRVSCVWTGFPLGWSSESSQEAVGSVGIL